jgi:NADPH2:quinone reductase
MRSFGGPEVLALEDVSLAPLGPTQVRLRMLAAPVNHSDLEIRSGAWKIRRADALPYVPGLEVVGEVISVGARVSDARVGDLAITMMQGLGGVRSERPGGYQELVTVDASAIAVLPGDADPLATAALGLAAVTAHQALARCGGPRIAVLGASGGVGSAAVAIAAARRQHVIAVARSAEAASYLRGLGAADVVHDASELRPASVDGVVDAIAGPAFEPALAALGDGGRYCVVGAMAGDRVAFSVWELLRALTVTGYSTEALDGSALRAAIGDVLALRVRPPEYTTLPLARAADAHRMLEAGGVRGRVLLVGE